MKTIITNWFCLSAVVDMDSPSCIDPEMRRYADELTRVLKECGEPITIRWNNPDTPENIKRNQGFFIVTIDRHEPSTPLWWIKIQRFFGRKIPKTWQEISRESVHPAFLPQKAAQTGSPKKRPRFRELTRKEFIKIYPELRSHGDKMNLEQRAEWEKLCDECLKSYGMIRAKNGFWPKYD